MNDAEVKSRDGVDELLPLRFHLGRLATSIAGAEIGVLHRELGFTGGGAVVVIVAFVLAVLSLIQHSQNEWERQHRP